MIDAFKLCKRVCAAIAIAACVLSTVFAQGEFPEPLAPRPQIDERGVDLATGQVYVTGLADISIGEPGKGGLSFSRFFVDSGWRNNTLGTISSSGDQYSVNIGTAAEIFTQTGPPLNPTFTSNEGSGATLTIDEECDYEVTPPFCGITTYTYTDRNGVVYDFSNLFAEGIGSPNFTESVLTVIQFPSGERHLYHYSIRTDDGIKAVRLQSVTSNLNYQLHFYYQLNGSPTVSQFPQWRTMKRATAFNRSVDSCNFLAATCSFSRTWPKVEFTGDEFSVDTITNVLGGITVLQHNSFGKLLSVRLPGSSSDDLVFSYDSGPSGELNSVVSAGRTYSYDWSDDGTNRTVSILGPLSFSRDVTSRLSDNRILASTNAVTETTNYEYDTNGRIEKIIAPEGNAVSYAYDGRGNIVSVTVDGKNSGAITAMQASYPATCASPITCNKPIWTKNALNQTTNYTYSGTHGGVLTALLPNAGGTRQKFIIEYVLNSLFWRPEIIRTCSTAQECAGSADELKTKIIYGAHQLPVSVTQSGGDGSLTATTTISYSDYGDIKSINGPLSGSTDSVFYFFDHRRRNIGVIAPDPDGGGGNNYRATKTTYTPRGLVDIAQQGWTTGTTLGAFNAFTAQQTQDTDYDSRGRPDTIRHVSGGVTRAMVEMNYDAAGRVRCSAVRLTFDNTPDACLAQNSTYGPDRISQFHYDALGRQIKVDQGVNVDRITPMEVDKFTSNGLVEEILDGQLNRTKYVYDEFDRLEKTIYPDLSEESVTYFNDGAIDTRTTRAGQIFDYTYDERGRITVIDRPGFDKDTTNTYDVLGRLTNTITAVGRFNSFTYDILGRQVSATGEIGAVSYQYNLAGQRTRMTWPDSFYVDYEYDDAGFLDRILENGATSGSGVLAEFDYNQLGQRKTVMRGNGVETIYSYDIAARMSAIDHDFTSNNDDITLSYLYTNAAQIRERKLSNDAYAWTGDAPIDAASNINNLNQPTDFNLEQIAHGLNGGLESFGTESFVHDANGWLVTAATYPSGTLVTANFAYDPLGRLFSADSSVSTPRRFLYDGAQIIGEYNTSNQLQKRYVRIPGSDEVLVEYDSGGSGAKTWLLADERGSIIAGALANQSVAFINTYDEYGVSASANTGSFQYTGQLWLEEAGVYHYKARAYNPTLGRFMQADPIGYQDQINLYAYVGNDPINYYDPNGLWTVKIGFNLGGGLGYAFGFSGGIYFGSQNNGSFGFGVYDTVSQGAGVGIDVSVGGSYCPNCNIEDLAGKSETLSGKRLFGGEISYPIDENGQADLSKTSFGLSYGGSLEISAVTDNTNIYAIIGNGSEPEYNNKGDRKTNVTIKDVLTFDPDLYARGYYDNVIYGFAGGPSGARYNVSFGQTTSRLGGGGQKPKGSAYIYDPQGN